ncbi:cytochrome b [Streptomyces canarius]
MPAHTSRLTPTGSACSGYRNSPPRTGPPRAYYENWHIYLAYALLALIVLHVAAALYHRFIKNDGVLERMIDGKARG